MKELSFKEKIRLRLIEEARNYSDLFVKKEYVIFSKQFQHKNYYLVSGFEDNYLHLTGVKTSLKAREFFEKCYLGILTEDDFCLGDKSQKGSIRRKISVLNRAINIFNANELVVEENFVKNKISCSFASADKICTVGFTKTEIAKPQTVLKGYQLKNNIFVDFILSRKKGDTDFNTVEYNRLKLSLDECKELLKI